MTAVKSTRPHHWDEIIVGEAVVGISVCVGRASHLCALSMNRPELDALDARKIEEHVSCRFM